MSLEMLTVLQVVQSPPIPPAASLPSFVPQPPQGMFLAVIVSTMFRVITRVFSALGIVTLLMVITHVLASGDIYAVTGCPVPTKVPCCLAAIFAPQIGTGHVFGIRNICNVMGYHPCVSSLRDVNTVKEYHVFLASGDIYAVTGCPVSTKLPCCVAAVFASQIGTAPLPS